MTASAVEQEQDLQTSGERAELRGSATAVLEMIAVEAIHESPLNPRKHFDKEKLKELARSIEQSGIIEPLLVRPRWHTNKKLTGYELAAGHRRYRAAKFAGLGLLPCLVRDLDNTTFLEILTIDNLQREDVHPLEEAQGYKNLLTIEHYNIEKIAQRVGKSDSYVYDRLKLLQLIAPAQELFLNNRFSAGHAILLARLSDSDQQKCLGFEQDGTLDDTGGMWQPEGDAHPALGLEDPTGVEHEWDGRFKPRSVRELQAWIDNNVRFKGPDPDTPHLFPETAAKLAEAQAAKSKVIEISRDHQLRDDAKHPDGKRTYCVTSWARADGQVEIEDWWDEDEIAKGEPSKTCEYSVLGLVVAGRGRGESFQVCIDKKRCMTHWGDVIRERNKRERESAKSGGSPAARGTDKDTEKESAWERDRRLRQERAARALRRWEKGGAAVLTAIGEKLKKLVMDSTGPAGKFLFELIQDGLYGLSDRGKEAAKYGCARGASAGDWMRHVIMCALIDRGEPDKYGDGDTEQALQADLDQLKIKVDVKQLLDAANPEPKKVDQPKAEKKKKSPAKPSKKKAKAKKR